MVLVRFPLSDLSQPKLRSAIVLADAGRHDWILCQVTSNPYGDPRAVWLAASSFSSGSLRFDSHARPGKLFTASRELMAGQVATLSSEAREQLIEAVVRMLRGVNTLEDGEA
ncbi:MAG: MazF family transcriptional regulator [Candidatus Rokubacteria bacterium]|nr:MazF family transcriptional regulator [Candidatus Rokubacteria bacterium]